MFSDYMNLDGIYRHPDIIRVSFLLGLWVGGHLLQLKEEVERMKSGLNSQVGQFH